MIQYRAIQESLYSPELGNYISYGVEAYTLQDGFEKTISHISDVFMDYMKISELVRICNECRAELIHLPDIISDAIN